MCRIAGYFDTRLPPQVILDKVKEMCSVQQHGGPDGEGFYSFGYGVLGHRRLSLLDLSHAGLQPMHYKDRYTITYNGEIYNFSELKKELIALGQTFKTGTDTEVRLAAFDQWNWHSFSRFNGMFSFALLDKKQNEVYLVRDSIGIKPLYYAHTSTGFCFASEVRAIKKLNVFNNNANWQIFQLAYGFLPEPVTTLENVKPLQKGCFYKINLHTNKGNLQCFRFQSFSTGSPENLIELVQQKLEQSVQRHLIADASIGTFLSGGVDSSILTRIAYQFKQKSLTSLSIYFNEANYSEKKYQDKVIHSINCNARQHLLTGNDLNNHIESIFNAADMPSCDGINTWFISKYAADNGLKAVLSGIGADELFGGYPSFGRTSAAIKMQQMPIGFLDQTKRLRGHNFSRIQYLKINNINGLYLFLRGHYTPPEIANLLGAKEQQVWDLLSNEPGRHGLHITSPENKASWLELNVYMKDQLLRDSDVMGMAHGIEIRVPFLDLELVDLLHSISPHIKFSSHMQKQLLVNAFADKLPPEIWNRPKMGFSFPFREWLMQNDYVKDVLYSGTDNFRVAYNDFLQKKIHWSKILSLVHLRRAA